MPIAVKRNTIEVEDINEVKYILPYYNVFVFRKEIPIILFYLSKGYKYALDYLNVRDVVKIIPSLPHKDARGNNLYFTLSSRCYIEVDKDIFNDKPYIQSIVGGLSLVSSNRVSLDQLNDPKQWIKKIANPNNYEKGLGILKYFNRLLDNVVLSN